MWEEIQHKVLYSLFVLFLFSKQHLLLVTDPRCLSRELPHTMTMSFSSLAIGMLVDKSRNPSLGLIYGFSIIVLFIWNYSGGPGSSEIIYNAN
jgi:hypothetical protein